MRQRDKIIQRGPPAAASTDLLTLLRQGRPELLPKVVRHEGRRGHSLDLDLGDEGCDAPSETYPEATCVPSSVPVVNQRAALVRAATEEWKLPLGIVANASTNGLVASKASGRLTQSETTVAPGPEQSIVVDPPFQVTCVGGSANE